MESLGFTDITQSGMSWNDVSPEEVAQKIKHEQEKVHKNFHPVHYNPVPEPDETFPYTLLLRGTLYHSGTMSTRSKSVDLIQSEALIEINPEDAQKEKMDNGNHVKIVSKKGEVYLKVKVTPDVPKGVLFTNTHFSHGIFYAWALFPLD